MLREVPCWPPIEPRAFVKAALKNCSTYLVGNLGRFRDKITKNSTFSCSDPKQGNSIPCYLEKNPCSFWVAMVHHCGLSTVDCAECRRRHTRMRAKYRDFPIKFPDSREMQPGERFARDCQHRHRIPMFNNVAENFPLRAVLKRIRVF
jgi:hypothetical protein